MGTIENSLWRPARIKRPIRHLLPIHIQSNLERLIVFFLNMHWVDVKLLYVKINTTE